MAFYDAPLLIEENEDESAIDSSNIPSEIRVRLDCWADDDSLDDESLTSESSFSWADDEDQSDVHQTWGTSTSAVTCTSISIDAPPSLPSRRGSRLNLSISSEKIIDLPPSKPKRVQSVAMFIPADQSL